jgi:hypothetical protein
MERKLQSDDPTEALWASCPTCDSLPGDPCVFDWDPDIPKPPGWKKALHKTRIEMMRFLASAPDE